MPASARALLPTDLRRILGEAFDAIGGELVPLRAPRGRLVFLQGDPSDRVYFVRRGLISLIATSEDPDARGQVKALRGPGSLLGLEAVCPAPRAGTARVESDSWLYSIDAERFRGWLASDVEASFAVLQWTLRQQLRDEERRAAYAGKQSDARLAEFLLNELLPSGWAGPDWRVIAELLQMRPETLSRCLGQLADAGAIRRRGRRVVGWDPVKLRTIAGGGAS